MLLGLPGRHGSRGRAQEPEGPWPRKNGTKVPETTLYPKGAGKRLPTAEAGRVAGLGAPFPPPS